MKWKIRKNRYFNSWVAIHPNGAVWYWGPTQIQAQEFVDEYLRLNLEPTD